MATKKKKPAKTRSAKPAAATKAVNKSAFVREYPNATAAEVVAAAAKRGIKLDARYVYVIRAQQKKREGKSTSPKGRKLRVERHNTLAGELLALVIAHGADNVSSSLEQALQAARSVAL
jgi:uncharacterized protein YqiB (DUF1249 family)